MSETQMTLDGIEKIFADQKRMMKHLKKGPYKGFMEEFRGEHGHYFNTMVTMVAESEDKEATAKEIGETLANAVFATYEKRGKVRETTLVDLNMFMIYYVFPAVLLTESEDGTLIDDKLRDTWNQKFNCNIDYTDYETLYNSFKEKIMGLF